LVQPYRESTPEVVNCKTVAHRIRLAWDVDVAREQIFREPLAALVSQVRDKRRPGATMDWGRRPSATATDHAEVVGVAQSKGESSEEDSLVVSGTTTSIINSPSTASIPARSANLGPF
jgi:hypothetical protein